MNREIVVLTGSPRPGGNTDQLADAFVSGAEATGCGVTKISTATLKITGCVACGGCYQTADHPCCHNDDFNRIAPLIERADGVVFATPLYWYSFPAQLKRVIDNCYCFYAAGRDLSGKRTAILACGEDTAYNMFDGMQRSFELIAGILNWSIAEQIYLPGVNTPGEVQKTDGLRRARTLGEHFFAR